VALHPQLNLQKPAMAALDEMGPAAAARHHRSANWKSPASVFMMVRWRGMRLTRASNDELGRESYIKAMKHGSMWGRNNGADPMALTATHLGERHRR
jgi:hypothetical protein